MSHIHVPSDIPVRYLDRSKKMNTLFVGMFVVGLSGFIFSLITDSDRAWQSYVSNWLFFTSVAMGAMLLAVATWITKSKWNWSVRRLSLSFVAFLPISFVMFIPMLGLGESFFPWIEEMSHDPILQKKSAYLNMPFLVTRNLLGLVILFGVSLYFAYLALRPDMELTKGRNDPDPAREVWRKRLTRDWKDQNTEETQSYQRMTKLGPVFVIIYAVVMSILSYDWVMSLEPHWFSTMMGPWFFMGAFWSGIAATACLAMFLKAHDKYFNKAMGIQQLHDLGKLTFAFSVFWAYLFFAQYLVIWYGKLPWEQSWIIHRAEEPWGQLSAMVIVMCFVIPFAGLMGRKAKMNSIFFRGITFVIFSGLWLEKHLMVAPSLRDTDTPTIGMTEFLIALMFLGLFLYAVRWFLSTFPVVQIWQPMVDPETLEAEVSR
tara:strand:- start:2688 stop:3977 length:1290 start_codon:yes stop_codon:yes gene_type:complete